MAIQSTERPFIRPKFNALPRSPGTHAKGDVGEEQQEIESLLDLIAFNVEHNPNHVFCVQASLPKDHNAAHGDDNSKNLGHIPFDGRPITFRELGVAVAACASWLNELGLRQLDDQGRPKPLALYLQSDVGLFILLSALLSLDVPVSQPSPIHSYLATLKLTLFSFSLLWVGPLALRSTRPAECPAFAREDRMRHGVGIGTHKTYPR